jgi:hypothetical protein
MKQTDIASIRLKTQQLAGTGLKSAAELVGRMGAIQAQDYAMSKWAVGIRLPGSTDASVEQALNDGTILRTHVLRPTWHLVAANDIHWMLELTAPRIRSAIKSRNRQLELTDELLEKCNRIIARSLEGNRHLTREELVNDLKNNQLPLTGEQAAHVMFGAELDGIVCSGALKGIKQTYALLEERSAKKDVFHHDEALEKLANRYFTSHAPATLADFTWWSGLSAAHAKRALEMVRKDFESRTIADQTYWFPADIPKLPVRSTPVLLLPAFDEFLISYKDRTATIAAADQAHAFTNNGIFRPTIVINGQTIATWKRTIKQERVQIEISIFRPYDPTWEPELEKATQAYAAFLGKELC